MVELILIVEAIQIAELAWMVESITNSWNCLGG